MNYALGCDTSLYQGEVDFKKMKAAGASFVFAKASQANYIDPQFRRSWSLAKDAGLLRGAYHFMVWEIDPASQADYFCSLLGSDAGELPPVVDFEWWKETPPNCIDILRSFVERMKANGYKQPMIYTSAGFWNPTGETDTYWRQYLLWMAYYGVNDGNIPPTPWLPDINRDGVPEPWAAWEFWQISSKGDGVKFGAQNDERATCKQIDLNIWNGSVEMLYKKYGTVDTSAPMESQAMTIEDRLEELECNVSAIMEKLNML